MHNVSPRVVIMAGGRGTRIASVNSEVPKPMLPVLGKPILAWQLGCLRAQGCTDILISIGYLGHVIRDYFGDGKRFGVHIRYVEEEQPLGTAGALFLCKDVLRENFLLINGDIVFDADIARLAAAHRKNGGLATIFTHPNDHPYDSGVIFADKTGQVTKWLHKEDPRQWYPNRVNAGLHMLSPSLLDTFAPGSRVDLDRDMLKPLISSGSLYAYDSPEYVKDMGTPERLAAVEKDMAKGRVAARNLRNKQKAIFLDRDGTINKCVGFLRDINDFELLPGAAEAIRKINQSGYLAILATNQPVIARGEVSWAELNEIHNKMETLLGEQGAYLDALYCCPHHPDKGFAGERPEYKFDCECRKPKPGMLLQAVADYNIDLSQSWMVGDSDNDVAAGKAAGCRTRKLETNGSLEEIIGEILGCEA